MISSYYLIIAVISVFIISLLLFSIGIKKFSSRRRRQRISTAPATSSENEIAFESNEGIEIEEGGQVNIYEAKACFEYNPDLLVNTNMHITYSLTIM